LIYRCKSSDRQQVAEQPDRRRQVIDITLRPSVSVCLCLRADIGEARADTHTHTRSQPVVYSRKRNYIIKFVAGRVLCG